MKYEINPKKIFNLTAIPKEIKEYIREISGENLKVLFLIFSEKKILSSFEIATKLDISISQVEDSIRYWKSKGILRLPEEENAIIEINKPSVDEISTNELLEAMEGDELVRTMYKEAEMLYKRPLRPIERRYLLYIFQALNLSVDVILMVVCFGTKNNKSIKQIFATCEYMSSNDITSHEEADSYIKNLTKKLNTEKLIKHCFGIDNRALSKKEKEYINKWTTNYNFKIDIIKRAYNVCIDNAKELSFPYIDKVLENWKKAGVETIKDIETLEKEIEEAEKHNKNLTEKFDINFKIQSQLKNYFGIYDRNLSTKEKEYINIWTTNYKFKVDIIKKAYDLCIVNIGKLSFPYVEKILRNWKDKGVETIKDTENLNKERNEKKKTSYSLDDLLAKNPLYIPE